MGRWSAGPLACSCMAQAPKVPLGFSLGTMVPQAGRMWFEPGGCWGVGPLVRWSVPLGAAGLRPHVGEPRCAAARVSTVSGTFIGACNSLRRSSPPMEVGACLPVLGRLA